jgi:SPX domain protein involved in polyphosphate accumulation
MRLEYKYIVPAYQLESLRRDLIPYLEYDPYTKVRENKEYTVKSIYLDSPNLKDYHDKLGGVYKRKKVRIRGYNEIVSSSNVFLEIKHKVSSHIYKNRTQIEFSKLEEFLSTKDNSLLKSIKDLSDSEKFLYYYLKDSLKPITMVTYDREAYFSKFDKSLRITFDKNLRFKQVDNYKLNQFDESNYSLSTDYFILEIKFSKGYPKWLQKILQKKKLTRQSYSKYVKSVDEVINLNSNSFSPDLIYRKNYV